jgi:serine O-acetyltransferase
VKSFTQLLRDDVGRCVDARASSGWYIAREIGQNPGLQAVLVYRLGQLIVSRRKRVTAWLWLLFAVPIYFVSAGFIRKCYGIHLSTTADIGAGFWVGHFGGVEVMNCRIGERCSVGQQTKVGSRGNLAGPQIGDGVWIGAHAKVHGPMSVGDGATIAPGARVLKNVPGRALVVGDPARVVFRGYDNRTILPRG